jgi:hypothetical protein
MAHHDFRSRICRHGGHSPALLSGPGDAVLGRGQASISTSILIKMGKDELVAMDTLAKICVVLDCTLDDIVELGSNTEKGGEK